MITSILKDLQQRFGSIIGQIIVALVIGVLLIALGKLAWSKLWGDDSATLKDRVQNQEQVIDDITKNNNDNVQGHRKDREAQEQAKDQLVDHIQEQADRSAAFDKLEQEIQRQQDYVQQKSVIVKVAIPFIKAAIKDKKNKDAKKQSEDKAAPAVSTAVSTPALVDVTSSTEAEDRIIEEEIQHMQQRASAVQDAVWKAYELAAAVPQS